MTQKSTQHKTQKNVTPPPMTSYAAAVNAFRVKCPDGTFREPTPCEVRSVVKSCAHISLSGERAPSWPALRAAERSGHLSDAIHLRRLKSEAANAIASF